MSPPLQEWLDPEELADQAAVVSGQIEIQSLPRLPKLLRTDRGTVTAELAFKRKETGLVRVRGSCHAVLELNCQRCLALLNLPVRCGFDVTLLDDEAQMDELAESFDVLMLEQGKLRLADLLEEELIMALPLSPRHAEGDCENTGDVTRYLGSQGRAGHVKPFADLKSALQRARQGQKRDN